MSTEEKDETLTRAALAEIVTYTIGLSLSESKDFIDSFFSEISNELAKGEDVKLAGFGVFHLRDKNARPGRNPITMEEKTIEARRVVTFRPSAQMLDLLNNA